MAVTQLKRKYATPLYEAQQRTFAAKQRIKQLHLEESFEIAKLITSKSVLSTCYEPDINSEDNDSVNCFVKQTEFNTEPDQLPCTSKPLTENVSQSAVMLPPVLKHSIVADNNPLFSQSHVSSENTTSTVKCIILPVSPCELPVVPSNYMTVNNYTKEENFENMSASNTLPSDSSAILPTNNIMSSGSQNSSDLHSASICSSYQVILNCLTPSDDVKCSSSEF